MLYLRCIRHFSKRPLFAIFLVVVACEMLLAGCGVVANRKPIPSGLPTATMHFGPKTGGFLTQAIRVNDGEFCRPGQFARNHVIGSYLGSDIDVAVPANQTLFVSLTERGPDRCAFAALCTVECASGVSFSPTPGASYIARLERGAQHCRVVVKRVNNGSEEPVDTHPELTRCLY